MTWLNDSSISSPFPPAIGSMPPPMPPPRVEPPPPPPHRFIIRSDVYYDPDSKVLTAMLELPGVKRSDLRVTLSTCMYNRVRQVTVHGISRPVFPESQGHAMISPLHSVRERKFGLFTRTFAVPSDLKVSPCRSFFSLLPLCLYDPPALPTLLSVVSESVPL